MNLLIQSEWIASFAPTVDGIIERSRNVRRLMFAIAVTICLSGQISLVLCPGCGYVLIQALKLLGLERLVKLCLKLLVLSVFEQSLLFVIRRYLRN